MRLLALLLLAFAITASAAASASQPRVLVSFRQTGGIAGFDRGLVVYRSGKVVSDGLPVKSNKLSPTRLHACTRSCSA